MNLSREQLNKILLEKMDKILEILESSTKKPNQIKKTANTSFNQKHLDIANEIYRIVNATFKPRQPDMSAWANEIRKLVEIDKIPINKILGVFKAANRDDFWSINIRSPKKLRKHWDRLYIMSLQTTGLNQKTANRESLDYFKAKQW